MTMETMLTRPEKASLRQKCSDEESQIHAVAQVTESGATSTSEAPISELAVNIVGTALAPASAPALMQGAHANEPAVSEPATTQPSQIQDQTRLRKICDLFNPGQSFYNVWVVAKAKVNHVSKDKVDQQGLPQEMDESKFHSCMFLTTGNKPGNQWMVVVPVERGSAPSTIVRFRNRVKPEDQVEPRQEDEVKDEDEVKIYERINQKLRIFPGSRLEYTALYVIKKVEETKFRLECIPHRGDKLYRVTSWPLTNEEIQIWKDKAQSIAKRKDEIIDSEGRLDRADIEEDPVKFYKECGRAARTVQKIEERHHLKEFLQDPSKAFGGSSLDCRAQGSCIYPRRNIRLPRPDNLPDDTTLFRGLHITMGWDFKLTKIRLFVIIAALVCLILLVRVVSGDWNLALQSGSVLATVAFGAPLAQFFIQDRERP